jgi:hypothetical protein
MGNHCELEVFPDGANPQLRQAGLPTPGAVEKHA